LHAAIVEVLARAVAQGGSTLRDFSNAMGQAGHFQLTAQVYDRAGLPCKQCGAPIRRIVQQQRSTYYCPACQRP
jgi:formamidopyrimidine-DNA glycosylase